MEYWIWVALTFFLIFGSCIALSLVIGGVVLVSAKDTKGKEDIWKGIFVSFIFCTICLYVATMTSP